ncbi:molecular chaperone [Caballeronia sp. ATUFL_M1_KS5A]|uniref:molecular chaperone n=1 Tax=Caballeronia sp. ATUFL_M1_KS5A TaxID=2921778 RepID=UPI0020286397|nr:molecular chaperone [Caballeronia sp. ATUFL_M1_KS5A]
MSAEVERYLGYISAYDKAFAKWVDRTQKIVKRYRDDAKDYTYGNEAARFNVLWSNVQTLVPATFSRLPQPDVSRRFRDSDPVGRVASLLLERALEFEVRHYPDFREAMKNSVLDRFLGGRGVAWVRYEPKTSVQEPLSPDYSEGEAVVEGAGAAQVSDDQPMEQIDDETAPIDYVHWRDFGHVPARTWEEVPCVWRRVYLDYPVLCERFGEEIAKQIPLDASPFAKNSDEQGGKRMETGQEQRYKQACIYEIWDKTTQKAVWLSKPLGMILDEKDDPLGLDGFWPCPKPLFGTITSDSLIPVPDFIQYQDQANELDTISDRIDGLIKALKVRGVYNAEFKELQRLFTETGNNDLIPVKSFAALAEKGGLKGAIDLVDLAPIAQALDIAFQARENVLGQIYAITGISDIMRGETDAAETAAAQGIKARFGSIRLRNTQDDVAIYATELLRLKAEVICGKFQDQTILQMASAGQLLPADQQLIPQALAMLRNNVSRSFRIEVDADSLVQIDEDAQKKDRVEFLTAISGFLQQAVPAAQQTPEMAPVLLEMMKFGVSAFKAGKTLEGMLDTTLEQLQKQIQAQQGQPKPPPVEIQKVQAESQARMQEKQAQAQIDMQVEAHKNQLEAAKLQQNGQLEILKAHLKQQSDEFAQRVQAQQAAQETAMEIHRDEMDRRAQQQSEAIRAMLEADKAERDRQFQMVIAAMNNQVKLEVAEIGAQTTLDAAQISAAKQGSEE